MKILDKIIKCINLLDVQLVSLRLRYDNEHNDNLKDAYDILIKDIQSIMERLKEIAIELRE